MSAGLIGLDEIRVPDDADVPEGHGVLREMDHTGDSRFSWNPDNEQEVAAARAQFDALRGKRYLAYRAGTGGERGETMTEFDPQAREIIMAPQTVGG